MAEVAECSAELDAAGTLAEALEIHQFDGRRLPPAGWWSWATATNSFFDVDGGTVYQTSLSNKDEATLKQALEHENISKAAQESLDEDLK